MLQITVQELKEYVFADLFAEMNSSKLIDELELRNEVLKRKLGLRNMPISIYKKNRKKHIKFTGIAGVINVSNFEIEVMPKFYREENEWKNNLFNMIYYARSNRLTTQISRNINKTSLNFYDHLAMMFVEEMQHALSKDTIHTYQTEQDNSRYLKGRLLFNEQLNHVINKPGIIYYEYDALDCENKYNFLLKWSTKFLIQQVRNKWIKQKLHEIVVEIPDTKKIYKIPIGGNLPPQYGHYKKAIEIANNLATGFSISLQKQGESGFGYVVNMEVIYEKFIEKTLQSLRDDILNISSEAQSSLLFAKAKSDGISSYYTIPDNKIYIDGNPSILIDAKYKKNFIEGTNKKPINSDIYQLFSSLVAHGCNKGVLISPNDFKETQSEKQYWEIVDNNKKYTIYSLPVNLADISGKKQIDELKDYILSFLKEILN